MANDEISPEERKLLLGEPEASTPPPVNDPAMVRIGVTGLVAGAAGLLLGGSIAAATNPPAKPVENVQKLQIQTANGTSKGPDADRDIPLDKEVALDQLVQREIIKQADAAENQQLHSTRVVEGAGAGGALAAGLTVGGLTIAEVLRRKKAEEEIFQGRS